MRLTSCPPSWPWELGLTPNLYPSHVVDTSLEVVRASHGIGSIALLQGGPSSRSCHKMCLDPASQQLYLLGRYISPASRTLLHEDGVEPHPLPVGCIEGCVFLTLQVYLSQGDFYCYSVPDQTWQLLSSDTHAQGGPHLLYDHQMTFDPSTCIIYVFGGRVLTSIS